MNKTERTNTLKMLRSERELFNKRYGDLLQRLEKREDKINKGLIENKDLSSAFTITAEEEIDAKEILLLTQG